ncbi:unnamed protein product, partial [Arabidopsis halleri]
DEQYEKCSTKHITLTMSLLTILMLFSMAKPTYMTDTPLLHVAGISGLVIFDEFSIVAAYVCLWALMGMIFDKVTFWIIIAVTCVFALVGGVLAFYYDENSDDPNFIAALSTNNNHAAANGLTTMALFALFTKLDDFVTKAL